MNATGHGALTRGSRFLIVGLLSLVGIFPEQGAAPDATSAALQSAVIDRRLAEAVRVFGALSSPTAEDQYFAGWAYLELHDTEAASPRLRVAKERGFAAWQGWPTVDQLLARIRDVQTLSPPLQPPVKLTAESSITVYAGTPTTWSAPVLRAVPEFAAVGRRIFGEDVPPLRMYLFADRPTYDRFFIALFHQQTPSTWQDGTGTTNVVVFCEQDRSGETARAPGLPETVSCVFHEFGHAWFGTYLMSRYGKEWLAPSIRRPWLDEGLADFVASLREPEFMQRRATWLKARVARGAVAPTFDEITSFDDFYSKGDVEVHYWVSALLVAEILSSGEKAPATIRRILDAVGTSGDVERSVENVTGKDLRKEFERVTKRFW